MKRTLKLIVCIKQVPVVSELPWNKRTGTLRRELADGAMNPACRHALEAALQLKAEHGAHITAVSMGPPMAEEVLREALAVGADQGLLLTDRRMAGADTSVTALTLAAAVRKHCPDFDLILCGCHTTDSETAQVGPQLAAELDVPGAAYVEHLEMKKDVLRMQRVSDDFLETLDMDLPGLVTIGTTAHAPRYVSLGGLEEAFASPDIITLGAVDLALDPEILGTSGSPTRILNVYSPTAEKENVVLHGAPKKVVDKLFEQFGDRIGGVVEKDFKAHE